MVLRVTGTGVTDLGIAAQTVLAPPDVLDDESLGTWRQGADDVYPTDLSGVDSSQQRGQGRGSLTAAGERTTGPPRRGYVRDLTQSSIVRIGGLMNHGRHDLIPPEGASR